MEIKTLEIFIETMHLRSFSAVARKRGVKPSSVSREMARLEDALQTRLFEREYQELVPTEAAEGYLERIRKPLQELADAGQEARGQCEQLRGNLTLAGSHSVCIEYLMPRLEHWRREFPLVSLQLVVREELLIDFSREAIDLGFQFGPGGFIGGSQLVDVSHKLCASPGWQGRKTLGDPRQLQEIDCLATRQEWDFTNQYHECHRLGVPSSIHCDRELVLKAAALNGLGPAILPEWLIQDNLRRGELVELLPTWKAEPVGYEMGLWAVWPGRNLSLKGRVFLQYLKQVKGLAMPKPKSKACKRS